MTNIFQISNIRRMRLLRHSLRSWSRNDNGFTLVEILVVSGISIILLTVIISILVIVMRGAKKSDSVVIVRQNGEQAMTQMVRTMRFAKSLDDPCPLTDPSSVIITVVDDTQYTFTCPTDFTSTNYIDMNGVNLTNSTTVLVTACSFVCTQQAGGSPTIGISFTLSKVNSSGVPEGDAVIPFQSSVTLRNINE